MPTGMKTGVSTTPWGVVRRAARAVPKVASMWKEMDNVGIVAIRAHFRLNRSLKA